MVNFLTLGMKLALFQFQKKGDLFDCNYRGISLINDGIKIISKIVASRISRCGLDARPEQFGFRNKEECISLFISIHEICRRRQLENKETFLAFLDIKKAYDSVPIGDICIKSIVLVLEEDVFNLLKIYNYLLKHMLRLMTYVWILFVS